MIMKTMTITKCNNNGKDSGCGQRVQLPREMEIKIAIDREMKTNKSRDSSGVSHGNLCFALGFQNANEISNAEININSWNNEV